MRTAGATILTPAIVRRQSPDDLCATVIIAWNSFKGGSTPAFRPFFE